MNTSVQSPFQALLLEKYLAYQVAEGERKTLKEFATNPIYSKNLAPLTGGFFIYGDRLHRIFVLFIGYGATCPQHVRATPHGRLRLRDRDLGDHFLGLDGSHYSTRDMTTSQFVNLQSDLAAVFAPLISLWIVAFVAAGVLLSILLVWLITVRDKI